MSKNIITCTGYGGTGSSAVSDLLNEFLDTKSFGDFEFRFLQDPRGLMELEFGIIHNNDRLITSYYVNNYIKYIDFLSKSKVYKYESLFNNKFKKISEEFIDSLVDVRWDGFWHQDIIDANYLNKSIYYLERFFQKKIFKQKEGGAYFYGKIFNKKMYYVSKDCDFHSKVKVYLNNLIEATTHDGKGNIVFDQLVPANNSISYSKFFNNIKIIKIDRDPRDLYLLNKLYWKERWIPSDDVNVFIDWYKSLRKESKSNDDEKNIVLNLQFEDFIYNYDSNLEKILNFTGIKKEDHINKFKCFNPSISIKNTNLKKTHNLYIDDVLIIEKKLSDYCYKFE